jgi:putative membrane-bound dehydrogenase-like protein
MQSRCRFRPSKLPRVLTRQGFARCFAAQARAKSGSDDVGHASQLWVAEYYTYADRPTKFDLTLRDRVIILADRDGDGRADERKVFCDNVQQLTSVEVGLGGVWLICLPRLLFIPDRDGDDVPDGPPQVVLDGFETSTENYHNCASGQVGPDGWLYGRCGASGPAGSASPARKSDACQSTAGCGAPRRAGV